MFFFPKNMWDFQGEHMSPAPFLLENDNFLKNINQNKKKYMYM